jgi:serine phosphatase RsbU (regulator of sigma subunit)
MDPKGREQQSSDGVAQMLDAAVRTPPDDVLAILDLMCDLLGAGAARFYAADYSLRRLQQLDRGGQVGPPVPVLGTLAGRVFTSGEVVVSGSRPTMVSVPLVDGTSRIGVLELDYDTWDGVMPELLDSIVATFVMMWIVKTRYSDTSARARRSEPLSAAAEVQWELLPPLSCSIDQVAVSGILEPAYDIGGDSFDYAFDRTSLDFAIVDAIGRGLPAVLMSAATINSLRNARRGGVGVVAAYEQADRAISTQFGHAYYVTGAIGSLDLATGILSWINAGHVLPMLVRNDTYAGTLACRPSTPLGLGGHVVQVAEEALQRGDRVLFYTDGITESKSPGGAVFGDDRLADHLVRAALEHVPVHETVRHLSDSVIAFTDDRLRDDATMFLIEWRGAASG